MSEDRDSEEVSKHKRGRVEIRGGQPLSFVEDPEARDEPHKPSGDLQRMASQVAATIKAYREAVKNLLNGKYSDIREFAPSHLREPCNTTVVCCNNGVIVRYDKGAEGTTKLRSAAIDGTLTDLAPKFSDLVLHFPVDRASYDPGPDAGINVELLKVNFDTGASEPISTVRIVIVASATIEAGVSIPPPPSRPPCLVSCTNELQLIMSGAVVPANPKSAGNIDRSREFVAKGAITLQVGWQALEVYPMLQPEYWNPEFAPLWAETDLLAAVARRQFAETQLAAIDPNVGARRGFKNVLEELSRLLDGPEEQAHQFLKQHPEILCPANTASWSKLRLGERITDFVFREAANDYLLVEIESPLRDLFRKDGQPREELTHAINQIIDWRIFIEDNLREVQEELGLTGISANPRSLIVIGRSSALS